MTGRKHQKKEHDIRHLSTFLKLLKRKTGENCAGFLQRSASPQNIQCHTKASRQSQTDSWFFVVPMNSLCFGRTGGEEKNRGIEERGERETWRDRGRDEEGRKKLGSHLSERGAPMIVAALPPLSSPSPSSLPPVSPAPRSPSAACVCVPPQGRRSRSGSPRSSSPIRWTSRPLGPPPQTGNPGSRGGAWTPRKRRSSRTPPTPQRWLLIGVR